MKNQQNLRFRKAEVIVMRWVAVISFLVSMKLLSKDRDMAELMTVAGCLTLWILVLLWAIWEISFWLFKQRHAFILGDVVSKYLTFQQMDHVDDVIENWCWHNEVSKREERKLKRFIRKSFKNVSNTAKGYSLTINMLGFPLSSTITMEEIRLNYSGRLFAFIKFYKNDQLQPEWEIGFCERTIE